MSLEEKNLINLLIMQSIIHKIKKFKFKKVHYFDLVVILIILVILSIFLYNRFTKKSVWIDARILVSDGELWWGGDEPPYWFLDDLKSGMVATNSFGEEVAEVVNAEIFSIGDIYKNAYVDIKLKVSYDKNRQIYLYNFQPIQKGKPIDLTFGSNNVSGLIMSLNSEPEDRFEKKIKVKMQHLEGWLADSYKVGMEMKDSNGRSLARIDSVDLENSRLSKVIFLDDELYYDKGQFKDVILEISLVTFKDIEGYYRFIDGAPIKIGNEIWFHFPEIVYKAKIMEIIE